MTTNGGVTTGLSVNSCKEPGDMEKNIGAGENSRAAKEKSRAAREKSRAARDGTALCCRPKDLSSLCILSSPHNHLYTRKIQESDDKTTEIKVCDYLVMTGKCATFVHQKIS